MNAILVVALIVALTFIAFVLSIRAARCWISQWAIWGVLADITTGLLSAFGD